MLIVLPFWTSFLIRVYAWMTILQRDGLLNQALLALGIVDAPPVWLSTDTAIFIGIVYTYLPFMVLPLYATLEKMDETLLEAAADLGCPRWKAFWLVTVPLALPGVDRRLAPLLHPDRRRVRHPRSARRLRRDDDRADAVARVLQQPRLAGRLGGRGRAAGAPGRAARDLPASAGAAAGTRRLTCAAASRSSTSPSVALGLAFLYLPIVILVIYSFNASRLVTVWGGWSTRWYVSLLGNQAMLDAAWISLRIAFLTACAATVLGTLAALALVRAGRFRGRRAVPGLVYAPLVMPEVITGLALLLLFVAIEIERGFWTVTIAHTTLTMCFVTVIVQARLLGFDRSLEEAAMDLGCPPLRTFLTVTLPLIAPAIAAGWVLAFMLSLDDLVIASFTTGPGATTLPIRIYSEVRLGVKPEINAICTIIIAVVAIGIVAASLLTKFSGAQAGADRRAALA